MKSVIRLLVFSIAIFFVNSLQSRHITGGVITYEYLGGGKYKIVFTIYKICASNANFDGDAADPNPTDFYFGIFQDGSTTNLVRGETLTLQSRENLQAPVQGCVDDAVKECLEQGTYEYTFTVPDTTKGYTVIHQRCCRNNSISNLQPDAGNDMPGITLRTFIPATNTYHNNAAEFKSFPPLYICKDKMLYFDHSATDVDGDSLAYEIVTPLAGLSSNTPVSINQSLAGVSNVQFETPYSLTNVMGGPPNLTIDPVTGFLTCRPNVSGWFAVAIMVKEYRNGVLINSTIRDYQFVVTALCTTPQSDLPFADGTFDANGIADYSTDCNNYTINFQNLSTGSDSFHWNFGEPISGVNNTSSLKSPSHTYQDSGTFLVKLYAYSKVSGVLCVDSIVRRVKVYPNVLADLSVDLTGLQCEKSVIDILDQSTSTFTTIKDYEWLVDGFKFTTKDVQYNFNTPGNKEISLTITDNKGCVNSIKKNITIHPKPVLNTINQSLCLGQSVSLNCQVTIAPPGLISTYEWFLPDGSTANTCNINYTPTSSGNKLFKNIATSDKGCKDSFVYSIPVRNLPTVNCTPDTQICYDKDVKLNVSGASTYQWNPSIYLDDASSSSPLVSIPYPNSQKYIVKGTDVNGCENFDSLIVGFHTKPFISAGLDTSVCLNPSPDKWKNSVTLNGQGSFSNVNWTPTTGLVNFNTTTPIATPTVTTDYIFQGTDANQCIVKDTVRVVVLDPNIDLITDTEDVVCKYESIQIEPLDQGTITTYLWTPGIWVSDRNIRNPIFSPLDTTAYVLFVENYCYDKRDTITINVRDLPESQLPDLDSVCYGNVYQFQGNPASNLNFTWTTTDNTISNRGIHNPTATPPATVKYYINIIDELGCESDDSMTLKVNYPPNISILGLKKYLCQGDSMRLRIHTDNKAAVRWENKFISDTTASQVYVFPPTTMDYLVYAYKDTTCFSIDTFTINVQEPIVAVGENNARFCKGEYVNLFVDGGLYYRWQPHYKINDTLVQNPQVNPDTNTRYLARIMNDCFEDSIYVDVSVDTIPFVTLPPDTFIEREDFISIAVLTNNNNSVEWFPKDNITSPFSLFTNVNPTERTEYYVLATDDNSCVGSDTIVIDVVGVNHVLLPSGFSPNGDGVNDYFGVLKHKNVKRLEYLDVYNRWGQKIYSTEDINDKWDGRIGNQLVPSGTYTWMIKIVTNEGDIIKKEGNISIIQ